METSSMTKNTVGNNGSEKWIRKNTAATDGLTGAVHGSYFIAFYCFLPVQYLIIYLYSNKLHSIDIFL